MQRFFLVCALAGGLVVGCDTPVERANDTDLPQVVPDQSDDAAEENARIAPDNSAVNERDRDQTAKTPFDQSNSQTDIDITATIRQRVIDLPGLSVNARNVKIVTVDGKVTLRGPVTNADERTAIEKIANDVAGAEKVDSQLEVVE